MKKLILLFSAAVMLFTQTAYADYREEYPWAADAVDYFVEEGILQGDETGDLMLGDNITQAQVSALLVRSIDIEPSRVKVNIPDNHWAKDVVSAISGYLLFPESFEADSPATREMYFSTVTAAIGIEPDDDKSVMVNDFKDISKVRLEYLPYLTAAYKKGLIEGSDGKLYPKDNLTRAEAVTVLYRALGVLGIIEIPADSEEVVKAITPLTCEPEITLEQAKAWARSKGAADIYIEIADIYWKYGEITGIRPDVLYIQAGKETGYGKYTGRVKAEMNNWAGIKKYGATGDETDDHETFETPDDGVRGHFNHMCAYVGFEPVGEPHGRYKSVKTLPWAGTVRFVEELGGKWCPDPLYGVQIVAMLDEIKGA